MARDALPEVLYGLWLNIRRLARLRRVGMLVFGLLLASLRTLRGPVFFPLRALATAYVDLFRGLPLIIVLYLVGFGVPGLRLQGVPTDPVVLGAIALMLTYSAYVAEVLRAGIESVHPSQRAAARSLGLSHAQTLRHVVLPQAVRRVVPPLLNDLVALQKDAGLISMLGAARRDPAGPDRRGARLQLHAVRRGRAALRAAHHPDDPVDRLGRHAPQRRSLADGGAQGMSEPPAATSRGRAQGVRRRTSCSTTSTSTSAPHECVVLIGASGLRASRPCCAASTCSRPSTTA